MANFRLEALWKRIEEREKAPVWDEATLAIAKTIARGELQYSVPPNPAMIGAESYVHWIERLAEAFGDIIRIVPHEEQFFQEGQEGLFERRETVLN